jgi:hypothetical protein
LFAIAHTRKKEGTLEKGTLRSKPRSPSKARKPAGYWGGLWGYGVAERLRSLIKGIGLRGSADRRSDPSTVSRAD